MRDAYPPTPHSGPADSPATSPAGRVEVLCACCRRTTVISIKGLFHNPASGSPRRFCSPACRQAAYRRRQAGAPEQTPLQHHGGRTRNLNKQDPPD